MFGTWHLSETDIGFLVILLFVWLIDKKVAEIREEQRKMSNKIQILLDKAMR